MDGACSERGCECFVDELVLLEERQAVEARGRHLDEEVVAAAGAVGDANLLGLGERVAQKLLEVVAHVSHSARALTCGNGSSGTGTPRAAQSGSQPSLACHSTRRSAGTSRRTAALWCS